MLMTRQVPDEVITQLDHLLSTQSAFLAYHAIKESQSIEQSFVLENLKQYVMDFSDWKVSFDCIKTQMDNRLTHGQSKNILGLMHVSSAASFLNSLEGLKSFEKDCQFLQSDFVGMAVIANTINEEPFDLVSELEMSTRVKNKHINEIDSIRFHGMVKENAKNIKKAISKAHCRHIALCKSRASLESDFIELMKAVEFFLSNKRLCLDVLQELLQEKNTVVASLNKLWKGIFYASVLLGVIWLTSVASLIANTYPHDYQAALHISTVLLTLEVIGSSAYFYTLISNNIFTLYAFN